MVMKGIEYKSTGTLFDEYATLLLRKEYSPNDIIEINKRETLLLNALKSRLGSKEDENISKLFNELLEVNRVCWLAQDKLMNIDLSSNNLQMALNAANAAKEAQLYNAKRNILI